MRYRDVNVRVSLARRVGAEALGTGFLVAAVVGSGIMGERLAGGNVAVALLANTIATGCALAVLIAMLAPLSGAHFNPAVTLANAVEGGLPWVDVTAYLAAQLGGAGLGVVTAHLMFGLPIVSVSNHARSGPAQILSEFVATFGLLLVIWATSRERPAATPFTVAAYIASAYWFTASTSFANPAVTLARAASDTFAGIRPADVPGFVVAQLIGAAVATRLCRWLIPKHVVTAPSAVVHTEHSDRRRVS
jgi:glycerol uptake facilitator-like aquaporin